MIQPAGAPPECLPPSHRTPPRQPGSEPISGYRLLAPLGQGGFGEVWKCEAPGGLLKAIKFVHGSLHALDACLAAEDELRAIQRVKEIRHPFLLSMERVELVEGELVIVFELADRNLADLLAAEQAAGAPGLPRDALLGYLREAAEALDVLNVRHHLQHLDIKPQNLFLVSNHVKVGDFGLVSSLSLAPDGQAKMSLSAITPLYAAPEVFQGSISRHCDQYSLAIVYQELLTGLLPFPGKNSRQLLIQHLQEPPDLSPLPEADRPAVARALSKTPSDRFPSCSDFIHALVAGQTEVVSKTVPVILAPPSPGRDTRRQPAARTVKTRALPPRPPAGLKFPGLEVTDLVSRSPLGEVWNARAADGARHQVRVIFGTRDSAEGVGRLAALRHPTLAPVEVLQHAPGRLVLAYPPPENSLRDVLAECQASGLPGIPRDELLGYLQAVAEALHELHREHGLLHLLLNPRTIVFFEPDRPLLIDFALAQVLWLPAGQNVAQLNSRYSAPELSSGTGAPGPACDQYSLALVYHEMLTGSLPEPIRGGGRALDRLPESDRAVLARALETDPQRRYASVVELLAALQAGQGEVAVPRRRGAAADASRDAVQTAGNILQACFGTTLEVEVVRKRLEGFLRQWQGQVVSADEHSFFLQMQMPRTFWQRCTGRQPGLDVHILLSIPVAGADAQAHTQLRIDIKPRDCGRDQSDEVLRVVGPLVVESVRGFLQVNPRGRASERLAWHHPLQLCPVYPDGSTGPPVECQGKDISLNGIGFYLPGEVPTETVLLHLPQTPQTPQMSVTARVVRVQGCGDGWYLVGAMLLPEEG